MNMKIIDLNELQSAVKAFVRDNNVALLEMMRRQDVISWFVGVYSNLDATKEVTYRYQNPWWGDVTIITTMHRLTIIDNNTDTMSYAISDIDFILYEDLLADLTNLNNYANMVYLRICFSN